MIQSNDNNVGFSPLNGEGMAGEYQGRSLDLQTHDLSERLTAMVQYFSVARRYLAHGDYEAADPAMTHFLEQCERAHAIAEAMQAGIKNHGA